MKKESQKEKVLLLENIHIDAINEFKKNGFEVISQKGAMSEEDLLKIIGEILRGLGFYFYIFIASDNCNHCSIVKA